MVVAPTPGVAKLVSAPGIGGQHAAQAAAWSYHGVRETAGRRGENRRSAAAVSLRADPRWVDPGKAGKNLPRGKHVIGAGGKRELGLVGDRRCNATRAKTVEHEGGESGAGEGLGVSDMRRRDPEAAGHDHDQRQFPGIGAAIGGGQKQFAVDRHPRHIRRPADDLIIVDR